MLLDGDAPQMSIKVPVVLALAAVTCLACGRSPERAPSDAAATTAPGGAEWAIRIEPMPVPAGTSSSSPQLTTSARGTILSWLELGDTGATLKFAERASATWSEPKAVTSSPDWFISSADVPSVLRMSSGALVAHWYPATAPEEEAYDIRLAYSKDDGRTWSRAVAPHHDGTTSQHGFATLFELPNRGLGLVWLDGRADKKPTPGSSAGMGLYFGSFDDQWKQTSESLVNDRVCECCQTAAAVTANGLLTAFRDRSPEEVRDVYVSRLDGNTWTPAQPVHADNWMIEACPVNGPALSARDRVVAAAWFNAVKDEPHAFVAFSNNAGQTWGDPIRLDDASTLGHVDVELLDDGSAAATWVEFVDQTARLKVRRIDASGTKSAAVTVTESRVTGYPRMARQGDELVFAWAEVGEAGEQTKGAVARLPRATAP